MKFSTSAALSFFVSTSVVSAISMQAAWFSENHAPKGASSPLLAQNLFQEYEHNRFADHFEVLELEDKNDYSLRIKEVDPSKLGIDTVKQWSGYLDNDKKHWFYWFFESRNDPKNDPVILWLNGGPGCSSLIGLLFELGPASIGEDLKPIHNPHSWNNNASVIFLEQPIGVGFSYGEGAVGSSALAAVDVVQFLELFFKKFPDLAKNDFHIAGESYGGHYVPSIAHEIITRVEDEDKPALPFNLTSIMVGNGLTDRLIQDDYYQPMACGEGGYPAVLDESECNQMLRFTNTCRSLNKVCYFMESDLLCALAGGYCDSMAITPYSKTGLNVYDIRAPCEDKEFNLCYTGLRYVEQYMNQEYVQEAVGSDVKEYSECSNEVGSRFILTGDGSKPTSFYVAQLLDRGIPVLIYAGDKDYICNWLGNKAWTDALGWRHVYKYRHLPLKPWVNKDSGEKAGEVKSFGPLTFLRVGDAGHMVPYDQPENALYMVNNWLSGNYHLDYELDK